MQALRAIRLARRSGSSILRIGRFCWRICLGEEVAVGYQRNELAKA